MKYKQKSIISVGIVGTGFYVPEKVLTNSDLEKMVDTTDEWIYAHVGIKERRIAKDDECTSDLATYAAEKALRNANIKPSEIELIIIATQTPDMIIPSTACIVQEKLKAFNAAAMDLNVACPGFIYALCVGQKFIADGTYETVLVVGAETNSRIVDWTDRTTCVYFADGAGAVVLRPVKKGWGILSSFLKADGRMKNVIKIPAGGSQLPASFETVEKRLHYVQMDGRKVWDFVINAFPEAVIKALDKCGLTTKDIDFLIAHQANVNLIKKGMETLRLPVEKTYVNIENYGNLSAASVPVALDEAVKLEKIKNGNIVVLVAFGTGLTWGAVVMKWC